MKSLFERLTEYISLHHLLKNSGLLYFGLGGLTIHPRNQKRNSQQLSSRLPSCSTRTFLRWSGSRRRCPRSRDWGRSENRAQYFETGLSFDFRALVSSFIARKENSLFLQIIQVTLHNSLLSFSEQVLALRAHCVFFSIVRPEREVSLTQRKKHCQRELSPLQHALAHSLAFLSSFLSNPRGLRSTLYYLKRPRARAAGVTVCGVPVLWWSMRTLAAPTQQFLETHANLACVGYGILLLYSSKVSLRWCVRLEFP